MYADFEKQVYRFLLHDVPHSFGRIYNGEAKGAGEMNRIKAKVILKQIVKTSALAWVDEQNNLIEVIDELETIETLETLDLLEIVNEVD